MIPHFGLARQYTNIGSELLYASHQALSSGMLVGGPFTKAFENWLQRRTGAKYAVTCHSGTQALEIIAKSGLLQHTEYSVMGNEVPTIHIPNLTYPATMNAWLSAGWNVEIEDTDQIGIMVQPTPYDYGHYSCVVGLYGANPESSSTAAIDIFDGAQHWLVADYFGAGMSISFDPTKNLPSSGNGGAVVTNSKTLYDFARAYRDNDKMNSYSSAGTNSKMSEQDCAQILVRTRYIDQWQQRREHIKNHWCDAFKDLPSLRCLSAGVAHHANQKFVVYTADRVALGAYLEGNGIECKIHYPYTLGELPIARSFKKPDMLSTSVMLSRGVLSLPMYPELTDFEVEYITEKVIEYHKR